MTISAASVKELSDLSGAGMMDAKKALIEANGNMELAIDWLRSKGLSKAAKKSGRIASEGLICVNVDARSGTVVEVNSETDFAFKTVSPCAPLNVFVSCLSSCVLSVRKTNL